MSASSTLLNLLRALVLASALAGAGAGAADPKAAPAEEPKAAKAAKPAPAEEAKPAKGGGHDEGKAAKAAPAHGAAPAKAAAPEETKPAKAAKSGHDTADIKLAKAAPAAHGSTKASVHSNDDEEAARLGELGTKIADKLAKAKGAPGHLVIRVKGSEGGGGAHGGGASHAARAPAAGHGASNSKAELHALVLAATQREAGAGGHADHGVGHSVHWSYTGEGGPQNWARLKPEFAKCAEGARQSPINIRGGIKVDLEPITVEYRPSSFSVIDNGHTVQVNMDSGNYISVMGRRYELLQFHFHRPAEERVDGRVYDMVAHLVHKDPDGRLAVVAVLMDRGQAHPLIQTVWNNLPLERGEELGGTAQIDLSALLPENRAYYTYMGSLTTPPCSEGVLWLVIKQPVQVSNEQVAIFSRLYPMNARPLQAMSGRLIKESN